MVGAPANPWGGCLEPDADGVDPVDPRLVPHPGGWLQIAAMEYGLGAMRWYVHDPITGVVWVMRPSR
eukprot:4447736-Lingulodinium_polyedra.AAC.1